MCTIWKAICISTMIASLLAMSGCTLFAPPAPSATSMGSLEGVISDAQTGAPLPGAQVTLAGQAGIFTLSTGADGKYKAAALPASAYLISVQATGYYVNVVQVGVVANVTSSGNVSLEPAAAVAQATPTVIPAPTSTALPSPTPIVITVVASPAPAQTPMPTPCATARSRAATVRQAPVLLEPRDGAVFVGPRRIIFQWAGPCCLAADEYFVVSIPHPQGVEEAWVKGTTWESPDYVYLLAPASRELTWNVSVRRHVGEYPNGQWKGPIVSLISETWRFVWYLAKESPVSPLPAPVSPLPTP